MARDVTSLQSIFPKRATVDDDPSNPWMDAQRFPPLGLAANNHSAPVIRRIGVLAWELHHERHMYQQTVSKPCVMRLMVLAFDRSFDRRIFEKKTPGLTLRTASSERPGFVVQSLPFRFCLPGQSISGWTTRMCRVSASFREKVFSSVHRWHRTFCLRALWIVSSCLVRS